MVNVGKYIAHTSPIDPSMHGLFLPIHHKNAPNVGKLNKSYIECLGHIRVLDVETSTKILSEPIQG